jgi:hypothetical protein
LTAPLLNTRTTRQCDIPTNYDKRHPKRPSGCRAAPRQTLLLAYTSRRSGLLRSSITTSAPTLATRTQRTQLSYVGFVLFSATALMPCHRTERRADGALKHGRAGRKEDPNGAKTASTLPTNVYLHGGGRVVEAQATVPPTTCQRGWVFGSTRLRQHTTYGDGACERVPAVHSIVLFPREMDADGVPPKAPTSKATWAQAGGTAA